MKSLKNNINMNYADVITQVMQERNLSQQALANIIGVNQTTVSQWLLGRKKPSYDNILSLYEKLGITPNSLFGID
jgi:transcriptional regulator with XRE-family HTH domain